MRRASVSITLAAVLLASNAVAQTTQTYVYDVQGRYTGTGSVVGSSTANVAGYAYDNTDNRDTRRIDSFNQPVNSYELASGEQITLTQSLFSPNNQVRLTFQWDGNLVLYCPGFVWANWTYGTQALFLQMQTDGNLVVYGPTGQVFWQSGTGGNPGARLSVQNDGNLVVYSGFTALWASGTGGAC